MSTPNRVLTAGRVERTGGLLMQASDDYVSLPHDPGQNVDGDFTIALWVMLKWRPTGTAAFIHKGTWPQTMNYQFATYATTPRHYFLYSDTNSYLFPDTDTIPLNTWSHWICMRRGSFMGVYRNGSLIQSRNNATGIPKPSTEPIELGRCGSTYTPYMVDRVRLYNRALSDEEISHIFSRDAMVREGLILCLDFTEGEGDTVHDIGPHGYTGTIYGRASWAVKKAARNLQT